MSNTVLGAKGHTKKKNEENYSCMRNLFGWKTIIKIKLEQCRYIVGYRILEKGDFVIYSLLMSEISWEEDLK